MTHAHTVYYVHKLDNQQPTHAVYSVDTPTQLHLSPIVFGLHKNMSHGVYNYPTVLLVLA